MKTGEEKFDDEIRQKLRHSEVNPPLDFFNQIVPPPNSKRGFVWLWIFGILILGISALVFQYNSTNSIVKEQNSSAHKNKTKIEAASESNQQLENKPNVNPAISSTASAIQVLNSSEATQLNASGNREINLSSSSNLNSGKYSVGRYNRNDKHKNQKYGYNASITSNFKNDATFENNYFRKSTNETNLVYNYDHLIYPTASLPYNESTKPLQQLQLVKPETKSFLPHTPSRYSAEMFVGIFRNNSKINSATNDTLANRLIEAGKKANKVNSGYEAGVNLIYSVKKYFSVGLGAGYSKHTESLQFNFTDYYQELKIDTNQYYILFPFTPPILVTELDSTILIKNRVIPIHHELTSESFSMSASVRFCMPLGAFMIEPQLGLTSILISYNKGQTNFNTTYETVDGKSYYENKIQLSLNGKLQVGYAINEKINLFFQGGYQQGLGKVSTTTSLYDQKNNRLSLGCGIKYNFFKNQAAQINQHGSDLVNN